MKWNAWGDPAAAKPLSESIRSLLKQALGVQDSDVAELDADQVRLSSSALGQADYDALAAIVGPDFCRVGDRDRLLHAGGKSTLDLLRRKDTGVQEAPDAVLLPGDEDDVAAILRHCSQRGIAVVPFGGGTSVVGGLDPIRGRFDAVVSLDLRRFNRLHALDAMSGVAELGAGVTGPQAESLLGEHGFSLGIFRRASSSPPSAASRRPARRVRIRRATGASTTWFGAAGHHSGGRAGAGPGPASAAGPDLRELMIGSEGVFGVITRVRLRVHRIPEATIYEAWSFPDFATGTAALRAVSQTGTGPTVIRLSDEAETGVNLATTEAIGQQQITGGCLAITVFEGTTAHAESRHAETRTLLEAHGGTSLGEEPAQAWQRGRFSAPYLRDSLLAAARCVRPWRPPPTGPTSPR
ncbi:FAD linked oxidase, C-terminal domain protein [Mycobacterium xenopi 4042]|uniref:FAD linked oxidase, C-terminal domain protein n=1 Tax=Mycobacterium xenopi 4042 TaxID=1299334 RepID=X8DB40_MYCXE|nr:FAD linked oxidase, C-terminal domain protein [Mycobacterium xenopi 4042]